MIIEEAERLARIEALTRRVVAAVGAVVEGQSVGVGASAMLAAVACLLGNYSDPGEESKALVNASDYFLRMAEDFPAVRQGVGEIR